VNGRTPRAALIGAIALALALAACGGNAPGDGSKNPQAVGSATLTPSGTPVTHGTAPGATTPQPGGGSVPASPWPSPNPSVNYLDPTASPTPFSAPWTPEVPVSSEVTPACIKPGGRATMTVKTEPRSAVAYHAMYAGSRGGAVPPYGSGYGGNDKGYSDGEGRYSSSWIVSPEAPPGPARLDVVVAAQGDRWGYDDPPFWVADSSGRC
jgi:hypothetical protein